MQHSDTSARLSADIPTPINVVASRKGGPATPRNIPYVEVPDRGPVYAKIYKPPTVIASSSLLPRVNEDGTSQRAANARVPESSLPSTSRAVSEIVVGGSGAHSTPTKDAQRRKRKRKSVGPELSTPTPEVVNNAPFTMDDVSASPSKKKRRVKSTASDGKDGALEPAPTQPSENVRSNAVSGQPKHTKSKQLKEGMRKDKSRSTGEVSSAAPPSSFHRASLVDSLPSTSEPTKDVSEKAKKRKTKKRSIEVEEPTPASPSTVPQSQKELLGDDITVIGKSKKSRKSKQKAPEEQIVSPKPRMCCRDHFELMT